MKIHTLNRRWKEILRWVDARSTRDRVLILFGALLTIYFFWWLFFQRSLNADRELLKTQIGATLKQIDTFQKQVAGIEGELKNNSAGELFAKHGALTDEVALLNNKLDLLIVDVVSSSASTKVLGQLLNDSRGVTLVSIKNLPAEPLEEIHEDLTFGEADAPLFQEGVEISFKANYFSTLEYIKKIEQAKLNFFWDQMVYTVTEYPNALVKLRLHYITREDHHAEEQGEAGEEQ